jgi:CDP-glucose 4,6-dehydratase
VFNDFYSNKRVLVTGNTGFKGSWLTTWLLSLGSEVIGYSIDIPSNPSIFEDLQLSNKITDLRGDIRDLENLKKVFAEYKPEVVFHLAAQPIVRRSYDDPVETFTTNAIGSLNVLESSRDADSICSECFNWIIIRSPHNWLCCQMKNNLRFVFCKYLLQIFKISNITSQISYFIR